MIRFLQSGNKAVKFMLSAFLLIICVSMLWYLIPSSGSSAELGKTGVVASVGGVDVQTDEVNKMVARQMQQQRYPDFLIPMLRKQIIDQLLQRAEVRFEAERLGLKVSDQEVMDELQNGQAKAIFFPDGKFIGKEQYETKLKEFELTPEKFEDQVREQLLTIKMMAAVGASVSAGDAEIQAAYKERNTKIKFQYAVLSSDELGKQVKPTEVELKAFFDANKAGYQNAVPEKRQVRYFLINDKDVESKVAVDPADIQSYYAAHQAEYRIPERVRVRHILIKTPAPGADGKVDEKAVDAARAKAEGILKQVKSGGDFAELAKKNSDDPGSAAQGGELPWFGRGQMVPEFEKAAFEQNKGQISDLVKSQFGFHIIQTQEKEPARVKPLEEMRATIEPVVKAQKVSAMLQSMSEEAQNLAAKQGLDKAAAKFGTPVIQSNLVTRAEALPGVGQNAQVMGEIFAAQDKTPQAARATAGFVFFELIKTEPARSPSLDEIRDRVVKEFTNARASDLLRRKSQELANRAHNLHDLAKAAKEVGATVKTSDLVGRSAQVADIGGLSGPVAVAFTMKQGEISNALNLGNKQVVLAITDHQEPSVSDPQFATEREQIRQQLVQQRQEQAWRLFLEALGARMEKEGRIKVNQAEMNNLTKMRS